MGNSSSSLVTTPSTVEEMKTRICGMFYVGRMNELYVMGMDIGVVFGETFIRSNVGFLQVSCLVRESSFIRATVLYPGTLSLSFEDGFWSGELSVFYEGPGQGWPQMTINQTFSLSFQKVIDFPVCLCGVTVSLFLLFSVCLSFEGYLFGLLDTQREEV